ncbi:hypothetical protein CLG85_012065 [Yangia mangrovi]|uniref:DUF58 domain-containing protein n=2 Tax=Alloyangia mangrovi TaxID=1779329 RepID=A0ABT2KKV9_9RHOB|nr:hypothetical protein [Alloyangia mangrovi]MCT4371011.1 hypothetical protein [Alloyangia mangrovi]
MIRSPHVPGASLRTSDLVALRETAREHFHPWQSRDWPGVVLVADFRPSMLSGQLRAFRSVAAAEALALIGWRVVQDGGWVALLALGASAPVVVPAGRGQPGMREIVTGLVAAHETAEAMALAGCFDDPPLVPGLGALEALALPGAALVIASGFEVPGQGLAARVETLSRAHLLRLLHVIDGPDGDPHPACGLLTLDANLPPEQAAPYLGRALRRAALSG